MVKLICIFKTNDGSVASTMTFDTIQQALAARIQFETQAELQHMKTTFFTAVVDDVLNPTQQNSNKDQ